MNFRMIMQVIGRILRIQAFLFLLPLIVGTAFRDGTPVLWIFCMSSVFLIGTLLTKLKVPSSDMYPKDGMAIVAMAWVALSLTCAAPFTLTGTIPNYVDAIFETVSGLTTTGASLVNDVESLAPSVLFWRSFTQYMGGMGILLMTLAIMPKVNKRSILMMRAEVPGPTVGKLASRMVTTARILYSIYLVLTLLNVLFLMLGGVSFFESLLLAFGSAGTGGSPYERPILPITGPIISKWSSRFLRCSSVSTLIFSFSLSCGGNASRSVMKNSAFTWR